MSSAIRKHVDELDFFSLYRGLVVVFKYNAIGLVDKKQLICNKLKSAYNSAKDYILYDSTAYQLRDTRQALLRSMAHISQSSNYHISSFNPLEPCKLETYSLSKMSLLRDIQENSDDIISQIKSGKLYTDIQCNKTKSLTELLGYINVYYPIVEISKRYSHEDPYLDIFNVLNGNKTEYEISTVEKISRVLSVYIEQPDPVLSEKISKLLNFK